MKNKIAVMMVALVTIAFVIGCARVPKVKVPTLEKVGPVAQVTIKAEPAVSKLAVGQSIVLTATAVDENGREVKGAQFNWKCDAEGELSATKGKSVTFTLLKKPSVACYISAKANGEEGMIAIEGK